MVKEEHLPRHIAIILDGNGRWARRRGLPRALGHRAGIAAVRRIITECAKDPSIEYLTLYTFSKENWKRPRKEIETLMRFLAYYLRKEIPKLKKEGVRLQAIGEIRLLSEKVRRALSEAERLTKAGANLTLTLALSYGGRDEIVRAARKAAEDISKGKLKRAELNEERFARYLDTAGLPDPDLVIRTAGEMRLSNFLLWQVSYAELYITSVLWPDFSVKDLHQAIHAYSRRRRRFGALEETR